MAAASTSKTRDSDAPTRTMRPRRGPMTQQRRQKAQTTFLDAFAQNGNLSESARIAGVDRDSIYSWQEHDEAFSLRYRQAEAEASDALRAEAFARAVTGWEEPILSMGKLVYGPDGKPLMLRKKSDAVLLAMLKARCPEYREKTDVSISGALDITSLAAEADQKFYSFVAAASANSVLAEPDTSTEG